MKDAKTSAIPSLTEERADDDEPLLEEDARIFRSCVGIALYITPDRPDVQRDAQLLTRALSKPSVFDRKRLVKLARYLKSTRT